MKKPITLTVNGMPEEVYVEEHWTLLEVLRDQLGLTGAKDGCSAGECGSCTVLIDGKTQLACLTLAIECVGQSITTIEGLTRNGEMIPLQRAFVEHGAIQCGFCTPGMILSAHALLEKTPQPSEEQIKKALSGNLCRCTGYVKILEAVQATAKNSGD